MHPSILYSFVYLKPREFLEYFLPQKCGVNHRAINLNALYSRTNFIMNAFLYHSCPGNKSIPANVAHQHFTDLLTVDRTLPILCQTTS